MNKIKNKNKFTTFLCACLMAVGSLFGLVGVVGDTYALTPSKLTNAQVTEYINNYQNYDYTTIFDGYYDVPNTISTTNFNITMLIKDFVNNNTINITLPNGTYVNNGDGLNFALFYESNAYSSGLENNASIISQFYVYGVTRTLTMTGVNGIINFLKQPFAVFSFSADGVNWYNFVSVGAYQRNIAYRQGLADADTTSAYNNGYNTGYAEGQTNGYNTGYAEGQTNGITQGQNNVINNPNDYNLYTQQQYQQNYINGQNNVINNPGAYGLYTLQQYNDNYTAGYNAGVIQGQNNVINNPNDFNLNTNQQLQDSYNEGFVDGEQSSDAYQNGYNNGLTDGQNNVINNPNDYNLYTQQQYHDNYTAGYNAGIGYALYGVFSDITYTVTQTQGNVVLENALETYLNGYVLNPIYYGNVGSVTSSNLFFDINFNKPFTFNNQLSFTFNEVSQYYLEYTLVDTNNNSYRYYYQKVTDNVNVDNPIVTIVNEPLKDVSTGEYITGPVLPGALIKKLTFSVRDNYIDKSELFIHQNSDDYNNGYDAGYEKGFINGSTSVDTNQVYQNGYNAGYSVGEQVGRNEGIASANDYSFFSMFGALFDVPVKTLTGLFNFNFLGINLFNFFTSLLTLILVLWLINKFI